MNFKEFWKNNIQKGDEGIDFGVYFDSKNKVWYVAQVGTGKRLYESKSESDARSWGEKNAKGGTYRATKSDEKPHIALTVRTVRGLIQMMARDGKTPQQIYQNLIDRGYQEQTIREADKGL